MIVVGVRGIGYLPRGSMPVTVVPHDKLGQFDVSVDELLCLCHSDIEDIDIHPLCFPIKIGLAWGRNDV